MKIAFTSCMDARKKPSQKVWSSVLEHEPEVLILLGDTIYMDYGLGLFLNKPRKWSDEKFANECHERYRLQANVPEFKDILSVVTDFQSIWDDHDFAWNNSYVKPVNKKSVDLKKRLISKALREQFVEWARENSADNYPERPSMEAMLSGADEGIESIADFNEVRVILLDTRYYRSKKNRRRKSSLIGGGQREWLAQSLEQAEKPCLVCTGTTLAGSKESWDRYEDFKWVKEHAPNNTVFLSGDIHKNQIKRYDTDLGKVFDITASGAARPMGRWGFPPKDASGNYGIINIVDGAIEAKCFRFNELQHQQLLG